MTIGPPPLNSPLVLAGRIAPEWRTWFAALANAQNNTAAAVAAQQKGSSSGTGS